MSPAGSAYAASQRQADWRRGGAAFAVIRTSRRVDLLRRSPSRARTPTVRVLEVVFFTMNPAGMMDTNAIGWP
jgi:hypothetical protein